MATKFNYEAARRDNLPVWSPTDLSSWIRQIRIGYSSFCYDDTDVMKSDKAYAKFSVPMGNTLDENTKIAINFDSIKSLDNLVTALEAMYSSTSIRVRLAGEKAVLLEHGPGGSDYVSWANKLRKLDSNM